MNNEKKVLVLDKYEYGTMVNIINRERTNLLKEQKDIDFITEILKKVLKAPTKKSRFYKRENNDR